MCEYECVLCGVCVWVWVRMYHNEHIEVRRQLLRDSSLIPPAVVGIKVRSSDLYIKHFYLLSVSHLTGSKLLYLETQAYGS